MNRKKIADPIAQRKLTSGQSTIIVLIERPNISEDDFKCVYSISLDGSERFGYAMGIDSVQALQLAMKSIDIDLTVLARTLNQEITWLSDMPGQTGFPTLELK